MRQVARVSFTPQPVGTPSGRTLEVSIEKVLGKLLDSRIASAQVWPLRQIASARSAQSASHEFEQQKGSTAQTLVQHAASAQPGFSWTSVHAPLAGFPQPRQWNSAPLTQSVSQETEQQ
jgi:hypothetical protein